MKKENYPNCMLCDFSSKKYGCKAQGNCDCTEVYVNKHCFKLYRNSEDKSERYEFKSRID
jgi:hypothetical protein